MYIEIDCPPLKPRPDVYLGMICLLLGLDPTKFVLRSRVFGCFHWDIEADYLTPRNKDDIMSLVNAWHTAGLIRCCIIG